MRSYLDTLSEEERALLFAMRELNQRSISRPITDPVAISLKQKGLLLQGSGVGHMMNWPFVIPANVWKELKRRVKVPGG
jgi:hypothetical protein